LSKPCSVCACKDVEKINAGIIEGVPLAALSSEYGVTQSALYRHKIHIPEQLVKAREVKETAAADNLMERVASLNSKAEDVYKKALKSQNLNAAIGAVRELRGITELYAKITGELQSQTVNNIIVAPEWITLRNAILKALDPYPEARQAVIKAIRGGERDTQ